MITAIGFAVAAIAWATEHLRVARLRRRLRTDPLTGLGNRLALQEAARHRLGRRVALIMLDLNEFKAINDTFGHRHGDEVLITVAQRLRALQRRDRLAVRLAGDEFALWVNHVHKDQAIEDLRRQLAMVIAEPMTIDRHTINVTASIGIAVGRPELGELLDLADRAMYRDKQRYANTRRVGSWVLRRREVAA
ncbi:GGDEF domain-containing protein [Saccharopolyspora sp. K220]|uniref:GGDEF domain-containing protein n=1 Tax=Saccharopolyspora soli TaxID=2926618 RepID=UPI001F5A56CA|nr:GGDEF domain-containing protein [Saccharopolyspora soli]MCI2421547.1 GGDEF domain-containing protein [Saccharopolyspora soli]